MSRTTGEEGRVSEDKGKDLEGKDLWED